LRAGFEDFVLLVLSAFLLIFVVLVAFVVVVFLDGELIPDALLGVETLLLLFTEGVVVLVVERVLLLLTAGVVALVVERVLLLFTEGVTVLVVDTEDLLVFRCETDLPVAFVAGLVLAEVVRVTLVVVLRVTVDFPVTVGL
jgi:hypothetical protein